MQNIKCVRGGVSAFELNVSVRLQSCPKEAGEVVEEEEMVQRKARDQIV